MRLLRLGIQPYFVYDGPARPHKRGGCGGLGFHDEEQRTGKRMLSKLRVPYYQAPGEAEAECVLLEREGIVDAIWTDDSDSFMFGAKTVIRTHRYKKDGKGKKINSTTHVDVYRAQTIKEKTGLDQEGFILMAMISGGDYDTRGLGRCGPNTAVRLVKKGFGHSLCAARNEQELDDWRHELRLALRGQTDVPTDFPCSKTLKKYKEPNVSSPTALEEWKRRFHGTYNKELNEGKLRSFLKKEIDINTKDYLKHIVTWLMMRKLDRTEKGEEAKHDVHGIQLKPLRGKAVETAHLLRTITFLPEKVTTVNLTIAPGVEDWRKFLTKKNGAFDPLRRIECEIPLPILKKGVPHLFDAEAQKAADKAADAEAKAKRALDRAVKASQAAASLARAEGSSAKRKRDCDSDTSMDEDVQPRSTKQRKTKATPQTARKEAAQGKETAPSSSSPVRRFGGLRVPPVIEFMDLDGFDTSLLDESSATTRNQNSLLAGGPVGNVTSRISNPTTTTPTTTKKTAVVVDLLDSSDDDEVPNTENRVITLPDGDDATFDSDLQRTREIMIARRQRGDQNSPRRQDCSPSQSVALAEPHGRALPVRPKAPELGGSVAVTRGVGDSASRSLERAKPSASTSSTPSSRLASTPAKSILASHESPARLARTPRVVSATPGQQIPALVSRLAPQPEGITRVQQTQSQMSSSSSQPEGRNTDQPSPDELRRRRLARFEQPVDGNGREELPDVVVLDVALAPMPMPRDSGGDGGSSSLPVVRAAPPPQRQRNNEPSTPRTSRRVGGFVVDSSPLFVSPEPEGEGLGWRGGVIDLTGE